MNHATNSRRRLALYASFALVLAALAVPAHAGNSFKSIYCSTKAEWEASDAHTPEPIKVKQPFGTGTATLPGGPAPVDLGPYNPAKKCMTVQLRGLAVKSGSYVRFDTDRINLAYNKTCTFELEDGSTGTYAAGKHHTLDDAESVTGFYRSWTIPAGCDIHVHARSDWTADVIFSKDYSPSKTGSDICVMYDFGQGAKSSCDSWPF